MRIGILLISGFDFSEYDNLPSRTKCIFHVAKRLEFHSFCGESAFSVNSVIRHRLSFAANDEHRNESNVTRLGRRTKRKKYLPSENRRPGKIFTDRR